jgi:signal transduction histidine kinase/FixJ family two-component response regulator
VLLGGAVLFIVIYARLFWHKKDFLAYRLQYASMLGIYVIIAIDQVFLLFFVQALHLGGIGIFLFLVFQAMIYSWRFIDGYRQSLDMASELKSLVAEQDRTHESLEQTITERTRDLVLALETSNRTNLSKSSFLANVSHEIRTPLNGIIGFTELLQGNPDSNSRNHFFQLILNEATRLQTLLDQVLDYSRIDAQKLELECRVFDIHEMFQVISTTMQIRTADAGIRFKMNYSPAIPRFVQGDPLRLRQIFDNLLSNAVKFTEYGEIGVEVSIHQEYPENLELKFSVRDTGIGIPKDRLQSIFNSFEQSTNSTTRIYGGSGLGTTIARQLAELMHGTINVESEIGRGSTFTCQVLLSKAPPETPIPIIDQTEHKEPYWDSFPVAILAEDYKVNAELVARHLLSVGWLIRQASNGQEAVEMARREKIHLILMDIQMPILNGCDATRQIREEHGQTIPIIGLSANAFEEDRQRALASGMDLLLAKPVRRAMLLKSIAMFVPPDTYRRYDPTSPSKPKTLHTNLLQELEGDIIALAEILYGFSQELQLGIRQLEQALTIPDFVEIHRLAHGLKGGAMNIGYEMLQTAALSLEIAAKAQNLIESQRFFKSLKEAAQGLFMALNQNS